ncbi:MAG: DUF3261 domain-containing protein [Cognaticolwellia sp.]
MSTRLTNKLSLASKLLCCLLSVLVTGCASTLANKSGSQFDSHSDSKSVALADNLHFILTSPPAEKMATVDSHLVEISSNGKKHQFIAQVEYRGGEIAMAAISPQGLPLFDFIWFSDKNNEINQYVPLPNVDIGFIIADIQLCNWPLQTIKSSLKGTDVSVTQQPVANEKAVTWQRKIMQNNNLIIKVDKFADGYQLENITRGYRIRLTQLER